MTQIQENLCEDCNCDWYDGCGCCHPKFERFPFKPRKKKCRYYVEYDNREDDYAAESDIQAEEARELDQDIHDNYDDYRDD
jgi:hypothetical protein